MIDHDHDSDDNDVCDDYIVGDDGGYEKEEDDGMGVRYVCM